MERQADWDKIIIGIDPGTNVMGYGILGVRHRKPELIAMGVIMLSKFDDRYMRLRRIAERVTGLVEQYLPDEMALEAPFYGKNVQSMLKLGRAQGVAPPQRSRWLRCCAAFSTFRVRQSIRISTPPTLLAWRCAISTSRSGQQRRNLILRGRTLWRAMPTRWRSIKKETVSVAEMAS